MSLTALATAATARLQVILAAVIAAGILHILATLSMPALAVSTPYVRLKPLAPLHTFQVLAPVSPAQQPLAFMAPDVRYGVCRYDARKGPVSVNVRLPGRGWSLSLYTPEGDNFYTAMGQDGQPADIALQLTPLADRFLGLTPEARGKISEAGPTLVLASNEGIVVVRAPDKGLAYKAETEAVLKTAACSARPF